MKCASCLLTVMAKKCLQYLIGFCGGLNRWMASKQSNHFCQGAICLWSPPRVFLQLIKSSAKMDSSVFQQAKVEDRISVIKQKQKQHMNLNSVLLFMFVLCWRKSSLENDFCFPWHLWHRQPQTAPTSVSSTETKYAVGAKLVEIGLVCIID